MLHAKQDDDDFKARARFAILFATGVAMALWVVWSARVAFMLLFAAILVALLLSAVAGWVQRLLRAPRVVALVLVGVLGVAAVAVCVALRGAEAIERFSELQTDLPDAFSKLYASIKGTQSGAWLVSMFRDRAQQLNGLSIAMSRIGGFFLSGVNVLLAMIVIVIASMYFAAEPELYLSGVRSVTPARYRAAMMLSLRSAGRQLNWWLVAKLVSMAVVGLMVFAGLWLIGVPLAGTLALLAAALTFVPNVGPIASAIPASLLAFAESPTKGLLTVGLFAFAHFIEGNFVTPLAERGIVKLPPGLTLAVQMLLATTTGVLGIALAAPLTAAVMGAAAPHMSVEGKANSGPVAERTSAKVGLPEPSEFADEVRRM